MPLQLIKFKTAQESLERFSETVFTFKENLEARLKTPILADGTDLWKNLLCSKSVLFYGDQNRDNRYRFKIDNNFDLNAIINSNINSDGSINSTENTYIQSTGTEFIIIAQEELKYQPIDNIHSGTYAIKTDQYNIIRERLNGNGLTLAQLKRFGGFELNNELRPAEVLRHAGWLELAEDKNFLKKYLCQAKKHDCFYANGRGMEFGVKSDINNYRVLPLGINNSSSGVELDVASVFPNFLIDLDNLSNNQLCKILGKYLKS